MFQWHCVNSVTYFFLNIVGLRFIYVAICHLFYSLIVRSEYIIIHLSLLL